MKTYLLKTLLGWLLSVTRQQIEDVITYVLTASERFVDGKVKNTWVRERLAAVYPKLKPHAVDALVGFAVGLLKRGEIAALTPEE